MHFFTSLLPLHVSFLPSLLFLCLYILSICAFPPHLLSESVHIQPLGHFICSYNQRKWCISLLHEAVICTHGWNHVHVCVCLCMSANVHARAWLYEHQKRVTACIRARVHVRVCACVCTGARMCNRPFVPIISLPADRFLFPLLLLP